MALQRSDIILPGTTAVSGIKGVSADKKRHTITGRYKATPPLTGWAHT